MSVIRGRFPTDGGSDMADVYGCVDLSLERVRLILVILFVEQNSVPNLNVLLCAVR